MQNLRI